MLNIFLFPKYSLSLIDFNECPYLVSFGFPDPKTVLSHRAPQLVGRALGDKGKSFLHCLASSYISIHTHTDLAKSPTHSNLMNTTPRVILALITG